MLPDAVSKLKGNRLGSPSFSWHFSNVSSQWSFADSFIYTLRFARSLSPHICLHSSIFFLISFLPWTIGFHTASFIQNPWLMPFIIHISDKKPLILIHKEDKCGKQSWLFLPGSNYSWFKKEKKMSDVFCSYLVRPTLPSCMSSSSITYKTYKKEKK